MKKDRGGEWRQIASPGPRCDDQFMPSSPLTELLKLPAGDRAELAMALWESLSDAEREGELQLSDEERTELDRRWTEHLENPNSAIPWPTCARSSKAERGARSRLQAAG